MLRFIIPVMMIMFILPACLNLSGGCEQTTLKRATAPGGDAQVVRLLIDCGATTTPSSSLRLIAENDSSSYGKPEDTILPEAAGADFYWKNRDTLIVKGATKEAVASGKKKWILSSGGNVIIIEYEE